MDRNGDGHLNVPSGSWPGELFLFRGGPGRTFSPPEMIRDKKNQIINVSGGVRKNADGSIYITGNATFEETPEGHVVTYQGKTYQSTAAQPISVTGCATAAHATDWDGDGDFDLIVGDIRGNVFLLPNEGTPEAYSFGEKQPLEADGQPMSVADDAGPFAADWDNDGDLDLLVGAGDGSVSLFRNTGSTQSPQLGPVEQLVSPGSASFGNQAPREPIRGIRSKVCATDWNGDGLLDLLVGDFTTQKPDLPKPTPEEQAEHDKIRKELKSLRRPYGKLIGKLYGSERVKTTEERVEATKEFKALRERFPSYTSRKMR